MTNYRHYYRWPTCGGVASLNDYNTIAMADFVTELKERRVLPAVGVYAASCWVLVEILDRLVERYLLSPYLTDIVFWGLYSLIPRGNPGYLVLWPGWQGQGHHGAKGWRAHQYHRDTGAIDYGVRGTRTLVRQLLW